MSMHGLAWAANHCHDVDLAAMQGEPSDLGPMAQISAATSEHCAAGVCPASQSRTHDFKSDLVEAACATTSLAKYCAILFEHPSTFRPRHCMSTKKKLLLIDDDDAVISYLVSKLAKYYDLVSTTEPLMAVTMARNEKPDLILCDIDMPNLGGGEVAHSLAEDPHTSSIPLIYLTGLVSPEEALDLQGNVGGRPGVAKRAPLAVLLHRIDSLIGAY
jgi:CheY-like chemotaxis protein